MPTTGNTNPYGGLLGGLGGTFTTTGTNIEFQSPQPSLPIAQTVSVMADGMLLVDAGWYKVRVPPKLFKDLVTLATLGIIEKLVPEEPETP